MISAENINRSGNFCTEIKRQQIKLSLMLGLERTYEMFISSVTTIHTTRVQEPGRNDVDISSCRFIARNTRTVQVEARNAKRSVYERKFTHEMSQLARG